MEFSDTLLKVQSFFFFQIKL